MDIVIYHNRDLDGVASGAIARIVWPDCELIGLDYGDELDLRRFRKKKVLMVDVSLPMDRMMGLAKISEQFIFVDHHIGIYDSLREKMAELDPKQFRSSDINSFISLHEVDNFYYFYSGVLSGCEMMAELYGDDAITLVMRNAISLLGQYDTWRDTEDKKLVLDKDWELEVLPFQWGMRGNMDPERVAKIFRDLDDWRSNLQTVQIITKGHSILKYQEEVDKVNFQKFGFEFELFADGKVHKVIALNGGPFNSRTFKSVWNPDYHHIMMPFVFNGKTNTWSFSMYTTRDDVDILSIAKSMGGGGHKQACGFMVKEDEMKFTDSKIIFVTSKEEK